MMYLSIRIYIYIPLCKVVPAQYILTSAEMWPEAPIVSFHFHCIASFSNRSPWWTVLQYFKGAKCSGNLKWLVSKQRDNIHNSKHHEIHKYLLLWFQHIFSILWHFNSSASCTGRLNIFFLKIDKVTSNTHNL